MCGICGFVSRREISNKTLKIMNDTMYHRGPNDSGEEIYSGEDGYRIGFAQRRLSIMDLSMLGHQPMHSDAAFGFAQAPGHSAAKLFSSLFTASPSCAYKKSRNNKCFCFFG